jgi:hypothetical protein
MARESCYGSLIFYVLDEEGIGIPILSPSTAWRLLKPEYISVFYNENWTEWTTTFLAYNKELRTNFVDWFIDKNMPKIIDSFAAHNVISKHLVNYFIARANKEEKYEIQVILMKYKDKINGYAAEHTIEERFEL